MAKAHSFYASIETLRQQTVAVRVAIDFPNSKQIKSCAQKIPTTVVLGSSLQIKTEAAKINWKKIVLTKEDMTLMQTKIDRCEFRGSCSVYSDFLESVKTPNELEKELSIIKESLDKKLSKLPAKSYLKAWLTLKDGCLAFKSLTN